MENRRLRRGDVRSDGLVFWQYEPRTRREVWITPEELQRRREQIRVAVARHYRSNIDEQRRKARERMAQPEVKKRHKAYLATDKVRQRQNYLTRLRLRKKRADNPGYKLECAVRKRIWSALKGSQKCDHSMSLIGCSPDTLRLSLEVRFEPGMTWQNYGTAWHVDHIIPLSAYDLTDPEQQREAFHYTNLQPMWAHENMAKGDEVPGTELVLRLMEAA